MLAMAGMIPETSAMATRRKKLPSTVGKSLEKHPNIKVIYTRKTDVFVPLRDRAKVANNADADLFVSIHCNSHHTGAHGTETFVLGLHENQRNSEIAKKENEVIFLEEDYKSHNLESTFT